MWKLVKRKEIYKNPWISVREDIVEDEKGKEQLYGVVSINYGTCVLPIDTQGNVYLVKQYRYGAGEYLIECPGGSIDPNEDGSTTAKRELKEELLIEAPELIELGFVRTLTTTIDHKEYLFIATGFESSEHFVGSEEEGIELIRVSFEEAVKMAMDSKIIHAPSVSLIMKACEYLKKTV